MEPISPVDSSLLACLLTWTLVGLPLQATVCHPNSSKLPLNSLLEPVFAGGIYCDGSPPAWAGTVESDIQLLGGDQPEPLCCSAAPAIIGANNPGLSFQVAVKNKKENAYNSRVLATFSDNLYYSSVFPVVSRRNLAGQHLPSKLSFPVMSFT